MSPHERRHVTLKPTIIYLGHRLLGISSDLPGAWGEQPVTRGFPLTCPLLGLAPDGVCLADPVAWTAGGLLHHRFTLAT